MQWTMREIRYLDEHANEGAEAIAEALGRTYSSVVQQAHSRGVSLKRRWICPRCGATVRNPLNAQTGWCVLCTKEEHVKHLREEAEQARREAKRERELNKERNRYYNVKLRAKKKGGN